LCSQHGFVATPESLSQGLREELRDRLRADTDHYTVNEATMSTAHRVDWEQLTTDLIRAGFTISSIAREVEVGRSTITSYREYGHTPRHETGERLICLWCATTGRLRSEAPRIASESVIAHVNILTG